jgi:hypothetical protein
MHKRHLIFILLFSGLMVLVNTGCAGSAKPNNSAAAVVEAYLQALAAKDVNQMVNLSCAAWEPQARLEYDSFAAVKLVLQDVKCNETGKDNSTSLVACTGKIVASYGTENMDINLSDRTFQAIQEKGEWRMCGSN